MGNPIARLGVIAGALRQPAGALVERRPTGVESAASGPGRKLGGEADERCPCERVHLALLVRDLFEQSFGELARRREHLVATARDDRVQGVGDGEVRIYLQVPEPTDVRR
jgi:hypothetical protein